MLEELKDTQTFWCLEPYLEEINSKESDVTKQKDCSPNVMDSRQKILELDESDSIL